MSSNGKIGNKYEGLVYHGDEPILDAQALVATWGLAWQRAIARIWKLEEEEKNGKHPKKEDDEWYKRLISNNQEDVKSALYEMGFIKNSHLLANNADKDANWFFENVKIFIRNAEDGISIEREKDGKTKKVRIINKIGKDKRDPYHRERGYKDNVDKILLSGDPDPKPDGISPNGKITVVGKNMESFGEIVMMNGWRNFKRIEKGKSYYLGVANKRTEHVVILTIPPTPQAPEDFGLALADYNAAGKTVPFTCCLT
jgi:hypothetical protein